MKFIDLLHMCFNNLLKHKLRSGLTLLGIILGAMSVSITLAMGDAIKSNNQKILASKGDLRIIKIKLDQNMNKTKKNNQKLYLDDNSIKKLRNIDGVDGVWAELPIDRHICITAGKNNRYKFNQIKAILMDDVNKFDYKLLHGKLPSQKTLASHKSVQVLAGQYFEYDFNKTNVRDWKKTTRYYNSPIEKYYRDKYNYDQDTFVLKPPFVEYGKDDMDISIPLPLKNSSTGDVDFYDEMTGKNETYSESSVKQKYKKYNLVVSGRMDWDSVKNSDDWHISDNAGTNVFIDVNLAKELITEYKRLNHITNKNESNAPLFTYNNVQVKVKDIDSVEEITTKISKMGFKPDNKIKEVEKEQARTKSNQLVLGVLGAITLFVASLSVANTMITSMYERMKEIGVMKVIGCKVGNIKLLFLLESGILGLIGGTLGMCITNFIANFMNNITNVEDVENLTGIARLLSTYMKMMQYDSYATVKLDIALINKNLWLYTIVGSVLVSIIAAYIPSRKASKVSALNSIKDE